MRLRHTILLGIIVSVIFPMLVRHVVTGVYVTYPTQYNTALGSACALLLGVIGYQRLHVFPGIAAGGYIFMAFSATFGALAALLLLARIEYGGVQLLSSYILSTMFYIYIHQRYVVRRRMRIGVIPSEATENLPELALIDWVALRLEDRDFHEKMQAVVADLHGDHADAWDEQITRIVLSGIPVYHFKQIIEQTTGRVEINSLSENTLGSLNPNDVYLRAKSVVDTVVAAALLIVVAPVILVVGILVRWDSPGPALFRQARVGYRGRTFTLYKIRTMRTDTAPPTDTEASRHAAMTRVGDPRITRLGQFLRRSRLDELPQLFNIIRGEMSLIGPRPEALALSHWYEKEIPFYHYRHIIKPGVTGWAQVNQGHVVDVSDTREKLHLDFYYVKNFSFWLDILIAIRTLRTMTTGYGAR